MPRSPATEALFASLRRLAPLPRAALEALAALTSPRAFARGTALLRAGERAEWVFFVTRGLVRELYLTDGGVEHTRSFVAAGQVTGSLRDLLSSGPSVTWIQALEPTETLAWRYADGEALYDQHPSLQLAARRIAEALYVKKARREFEMLALPASERYRLWLEENPHLDTRVTRRHLASYLGVTPEHLSRLRRASTPARR
jgi:CRP-like cAMP-binding protein